MIAQAEAAGADWRLLYGGRHRASMAFLPELAQYGDRVTVVPQDEAGFLDLDGVLGTPQDGNAGVLLRPRGAALRGGGQVRDVALGQPAPGAVLGQAAGDVGRSPTRASSSSCSRPASLSRCHRTVSVFEAALEAGANVLGSCMEGICGTCETEVVEGDVDHRDSVLNEEERASNEFMMICVSRCKSKRLVLDI